MRLDAGRLHKYSPRDSMAIRRYMGGGLGGFYLVMMGRWFLYVDWIR